MSDLRVLQAEQLTQQFIENFIKTKQLRELMSQL